MESLQAINWLAVVLAMVVAMALGAVWYSPILFADMWQKELKIKASQMGGNPMIAMIGAALLTLVQAAMLAMLIGQGDMLTGLKLGALISLGIVCAAIGVQYSFENRSMRLFAINSGYIVLTCTAMGAILGAWH